MSFLRSYRIAAALVLCLVSCVLSIIHGVWGLGGLLIFGLTARFLDDLFVLSPFVPFVLFIISLASLRWAALSMWTYSLIYWLTGVALSWPHANLSPFTSHGSEIQIAANCAITLAYLVLTVGRGKDKDSDGAIGLVTLLQGRY